MKPPVGDGSILCSSGMVQTLINAYEKERSRGTTALLLSSELSGQGAWGAWRVTGRGVNAVDVAEFRGPHCHRRW
jgi:hypothetical protein